MKPCVFHLNNDDTKNVTSLKDAIVQTVIFS